MFTKQMPMLQGLTEYFPEAAVAMLTGVLGQCNAELDHRGPVTISTSPPPEATQATLTLNNYQQDSDGNPTGKALELPHGDLWMGNGVIRDSGGNQIGVSYTVEGVLSDALGSTEATQAITVSRWWGGPNPGASITAHNPPSGLYGDGNYVFHGQSGAWCKAVYDIVAKHWRIQSVECGAPE